MPVPESHCAADNSRVPVLKATSDSRNVCFESREQNAGGDFGLPKVTAGLRKLGGTSDALSGPRKSTATVASPGWPSTTAEDLTQLSCVRGDNALMITTMATFIYCTN